jgi:hypothetical protein
MSGSGYYRPHKPTRFDDFGRVPKGSAHHGNAIEFVMAYNSFEPGTNGGGLFLPVVFDQYKDNESDPDYIAMGAAPDARQLYDPGHLICAGRGEMFFVFRDHYRGVWMPLHAHGLWRNGTLGDELPPEGESAGSSIDMIDKDGNGIGALSDITIYSGHSIGDPIPSGQSVPVFYVSSEQKWYVTISHFEPEGG